MLAANLSLTIDQNSTLVSILDKKNTVQPPPPQRKTGALIEQLYGTNNSATIKWRLYKCKECHAWTHAVNETQNKYAILLNNRVIEGKNRNHHVNIKTLTSNSKQSQIEVGNQLSVRVPVLQKLKLNLPF